MSTKPKDNYTFTNASAVPARLLDPAVRLFKSWDMPDSDDAYLTSFFPDASLLFGTLSKGHSAIKAAREALIHPTNGPVVDLQHDLEKYFVLAGADTADDKGDAEIIMSGSIWYLLRNGVKVPAHWASRAEMAVDPSDGETRIRFYEVYLDSLPLVTAIGRMTEKDASNGVH